MKIFLSGVSSEFEACRNALASDLRAVGAEVLVQSEFTQQGRSLLEKLETYIAGCDRVIALVGNTYGWEPDVAALPPGTPRRSYTQWEYAFAQGTRLDGPRQPAKDTFVYFVSPEFPRPEAAGQPPELTALQQAFITSFRTQDKDHSTFGSVYELRVLVLRDGFRLGGDTSQPELTLELFNLTESTRFFYGAQRVPIVGRDHALNAVAEFLRADAAFAWWLMTGPSGVGKSRTALEGCLRALRYRPAWRAGWLTNIGAFTGWSTWQPKAPTLIVVDDAARVVDATRQMIVALFRRRATLAHPIRVLLLERDAGERWRDRLTGSGADRHSLDESRYSEPLELPGLDAPDLWSIVQAIVEKEKEKDGAGPDRDRTIAALEQIDALKRPLFASFAADALVAGRDIAQWDRKELLESLLKTDRHGRWEPAGATDEDQNLLAVATLANGLPLTVLKTPPIAGWLPAPRAYSPDRYRVMCGRPSDEVLSPLTPDILGEFFVLEHLRPSSAIDERPAALLEIALALPSTRRMSSMSYGWTRGQESDRVARLRQHLYFVGRCARDFPNHPSLEQLRGPLPEPGENTWGWSIDVANLIEELLPLPGTLDFCSRLHDALYEVAFERANERGDLPPLRICTTGVKLVTGSLNARELDAAAHRHRLLQSVAAAEPSLARFPVGTGAALAKVLALDGKLTEANRLFGQAADAWLRLDAGDRSASVDVLVMFGKTLVEESVQGSRLDLADARYTEISKALEGYVDDNGTLVPYVVDTIRPLLRARLEKGRLADAHAAYDDLRRLTMRYSPAGIASDDAPTIEDAPVESDPKPIVSMQRSESGSTSLTAEWKPASNSHMGQTIATLFRTMFFEPLLGQEIGSTTGKQHAPPADVGPKLRENMAARAVELMQVYSDADDVEHATELQGDLRKLAADHPDEPAPPYLYGHGTHILWGMHWREGELTLAARAGEELHMLAVAHAEDDPAYVKGFALAAYETIEQAQKAGPQAVAELVHAWSDMLCRDDARTAIAGKFGASDTEVFYALLAQHSGLKDRLTVLAPPTDAP